MKKLRAIIIDDELDSIENLSTSIREFTSRIEIVGTDVSITGGLKIWRNLRPDVVFVDIEMHGGTGFDVCELANDHMAKVVFFTAHEQYAIRALKMGAIDYLLKPLDIDELIELENRLIRLQQASNGSSHKGVGKIAFPIANGYRYLDPSKILMIKADRSYSILHMNGCGRLVISKNIRVLEGMLAGLGFYRCHKSYMVNIGTVEEYSRKDGGMVVLSDGTEVPVSKDRRQALLDGLSQ